MSLFNGWYTKSSTFEEFEVAQNQTIDQSGNGLRDNWVTAVQLAFKSSFKDVGESSDILATTHLNDNHITVVTYTASHAVLCTPRDSNTSVVWHALTTYLAGCIKLDLVSASSQLRVVPECYLCNLTASIVQEQ